MGSIQSHAEGSPKELTAGISFGSTFTCEEGCRSRYPTGILSASSSVSAAAAPAEGRSECAQVESLQERHRGQSGDGGEVEGAVEPIMGRLRLHRRMRGG